MYNDSVVRKFFLYAYWCRSNHVIVGVDVFFHQCNHSLFSCPSTVDPFCSVAALILEGYYKLFNKFRFFCFLMWMNLHSIILHGILALLLRILCWSFLEHLFSSSVKLIEIQPNNARRVKNLLLSSAFKRKTREVELMKLSLWHLSNGCI